jgi:eukaryotic-like serine/threonine-protein kinase
MRLNIPDRYVPNGRTFSGGMGEVILCNDTYLDRTVAIKVISSIPERARIQDEIKALQQIRSNHVVQIFDIFIDTQDSDRKIGLVQEYLPGEDLKSLTKKKLSKDEYLKVLFQISSGISDIHGENLIHRDIKPNNMKFDQEGLIKIFDFGLTRSQEANAWTVGFRGTRGFAAPELYQNGSVFFSEAVDVYAFGITAWFLDEVDLTEELKEMPPKPNARSFESLRDLPIEIANILDRTLLKDPEQRPKITDVRDTISRYLLYGKHQALIVAGTESYTLKDINKSVELNYTTIGSLEITYDGLDFVVNIANGEVFVNNMPTNKGYRLPGSCVITLGAIEHGAARKFITFDISHPEVVL